MTALPQAVARGRLLSQCNETFLVVPGHCEVVDPKRSTQDQVFTTLVWTHVVLIPIATEAA